MGGSIALTIRFSLEKTYRGSCWTNTLPDGLWTASFYVDLDTSRKHAEQWLDRLLENRRQDPALEELWGGHNMLAPLEYGLVVVDYVTSTIISTQGYSSPNWLINWASHPKGGKTPTRDDLVALALEDQVDKWKALDAAKLLVRPGPWPEEIRESAYVKLPFAHEIIGDVNKIDATLQAWCETNFGLSDAERAEWAAWFTEHDDT